MFSFSIVKASWSLISWITILVLKLNFRARNLNYSKKAWRNFGANLLHSNFDIFIFTFIPFSGLTVKNVNYSEPVFWPQTEPYRTRNWPSPFFQTKGLLRFTVKWITLLFISAMLFALSLKKNDAPFPELLGSWSTIKAENGHTGWKYWLGSLDTFYPNF